MTADSKLVSIVVISFNHAAFLEECLDSVLAQTYPHWELIIADDASTDDSAAIIKKWIAKNNINVKTNLHTQNTGIGTVLNECIDLSNGEYIKFIAADDVLHPELIASAVETFQHSDHELGVVFTNAQYIDEHSEVQDKMAISKDQVIPGGWVRAQLQEKNFVPAPSVVIKKAVYDKIGKYDPLIKTDDYDCWLRASRFFKFQYIDLPLVFYRVHSNNISHSIDFSNDNILLLLRNDVAGDFSARIKKLIMDRYYVHNIKKEVLVHYDQYQYKDKWLVFSLKKQLPYQIFRIVDMVINYKTDATV